MKKCYIFLAIFLHIVAAGKTPEYHYLPLYKLIPLGDFNARTRVFPRKIATHPDITGSKMAAETSDGLAGPFSIFFCPLNGAFFR